jgi:hypothetical protein
VPDLDHVVDALSSRTKHVFATAQGAERYRCLVQRLDQIRGAFELARLLDDRRLARRIETHMDAVRRDIEAD